VATQKQIEANRANAKLSTGPRTPAGKEASAGNAVSHGMTAEKYLTMTESAEEFEAAFAARRRFYPEGDPIIDSLVRKITLAHFRIDRAYEAEAEMLNNNNDSLADVLVRHDQPVKKLNGYESSNCRTLKLLEEELERYVSMLNETGETDETDGDPDPPSPTPKGPSTKKKKPVKPDTRDRVAPPVSMPTAAAAATANGSRNPVDPPAATGGSPGETYSTKTSSVAASPRPTSAAGANPKSKPMPASSSEASISPPRVPSGAGGNARPAAATSSVTAPPATTSTTREAPIVKAMPASGREASISPPAVPCGSRSESVSTVTAPLLSPPPATAPPGQNSKTNPISTAGCNGADHTTSVRKIAMPPLEASRPPATATGGPMKETRTAVPIAKAPGAAAVRMPEAATVSMSAAPAPPSPPVFTPDQMRKPPQTNFDINNWGNPAPRSVIRR
jgi:hypothetical protein